jgi:hypothetical protein
VWDECSNGLWLCNGLPDASVPAFPALDAAPSIGVCGTAHTLNVISTTCGGDFGSL